MIGYGINWMDNAQDRKMLMYQDRLAAWELELITNVHTMARYADRAIKLLKDDIIRMEIEKKWKS